MGLIQQKIAISDTNKKIQFFTLGPQTCLRNSPSNFFGVSDYLVNSVEKLTTHTCISRAQTSYLQKQKDILDNYSAIVLVDFSENYSFVVQNEVQAFH